MQNIEAKVGVIKITDEALLKAAQDAERRGETDFIKIIRKHVPAGKLKDCPPDKREALVTELNQAGCPVDAVQLYEKLAQVAKGHGGQLSVVGFSDKGPPILEFVKNEGETVAADLVAATARITSHAGYNVYVAPALFRLDLAPGSRGKEEDVVGVLALVTDFDKGHAPETRHDRLPFATWCEVESSPGNYQCWRFFDRPYPVAKVKPLLGALVNVLGVDTCKSCEHVYRVPGTLNYPNAAKLKAGRSPDPVRGRLVPEFDRDIFAPDMTLDAVKASMVAKFGATVFTAPAETKNKAGNWTEADWHKRATAKIEMDAEQLRQRLDTPVAHGKNQSPTFRSAGLSKQVYMPLRQHGYTPEEAFETIKAHPGTGFYVKAFEEKGERWLRQDIERWWKAQQPITAPSETFADAAAKQAPGNDLDAAIAETQEAEGRLDKPGVRYTAEDFEREQKRLNTYLNLLNRHFCVANVGTIAKQAKIIEFTKDGSQLHFMNTEDFQLRFKPLRVWLNLRGKDPKWYEVSQIWLTWPQRRQYLDDGLVFAPGQPLEWNGGLNRWRGFAIEPKQGDWAPLRDLIVRVLCGGNTELSEYLLNWLAHLVQRPGVLIGSCIALRSDHEGAGKGTLGKTIGSFFGPNYAYIQRGADFTGRFNGSLAETLFAVLDEAMFAGDHEASEMLKTLVSDDQRRTEQKNLPVEYIQNHINVMIFGNNEWLVRTGLKNRRFVYINVPETYPPNDPYWLQFYIEQDHAYRPGVKHKLPPLKMREAMLYDLLHRDITKFDPRSIPHTLEEGRQKVLSMSGVQGFIYAILQDGEIEFPNQGSNRTSTRPWRKDGLIIRRSDFHNALCHYWAMRNERGPVPSRESVGRAMQRMLPLCVQPNRTRDRTINPDYSHCYKFEPLDTCRAAFDMEFGSPLPPWDDPLDTDATEQEVTNTLDADLGIVSEEHPKDDAGGEDD